MITLADVEHAPSLGRYDDASQVVDLAGYPRVHVADTTGWVAAGAGYGAAR